MKDDKIRLSVNAKGHEIQTIIFKQKGDTAAMRRDQSHSNAGMHKKAHPNREKEQTPQSNLG